MMNQRGIVLTPYLVLLVVIVIAVLSVRLAIVTGQRDVLQTEKTERERRDAMRDLANNKNKERTDAEYAASKSRASTARLRLDGPGIRPRKELAGGGDGPLACFDRGKLNQELAGVVERHAERLSGIAQSGEGVAAAYRACQAWGMSLQ